jgi:hypothetical protein
MLGVYWVVSDYRRDRIGIGCRGESLLYVIGSLCIGWSLTGGHPSLSVLARREFLGAAEWILGLLHRLRYCGS